MNKESTRENKRSKFARPSSNRDTPSRPSEPIRLDWLDGHVEFRGLQFDNAIVEARFPWSKDDIMDSWVFDLGRAGSDQKSGRGRDDDDDEDDDDESD